MTGRVASSLRARTRTRRAVVRGMQCIALLAASSCPAWAQGGQEDAPPAQGTMSPLEVVGDAIPRPLTQVPGDAARGRAIVASRQAGLCLLCHTGPFPEERFQGNLAPDLAGAGARWTEGQLRLRIADPQRVNPASPMPAYHRVDGLSRVGAAWRGRPILTAQQVEDVVAFLRTLKP